MLFWVAVAVGCLSAHCEMPEYGPSISLYADEAACEVGVAQSKDGVRWLCIGTSAVVYVPKLGF